MALGVEPKRVSTTGLRPYPLFFETGLAKLLGLASKLWEAEARGFHLDVLIDGLEAGEVVCDGRGIHAVPKLQSGILALCLLSHYQELCSI